MSILPSLNQGSKSSSSSSSSSLQSVSPNHGYHHNLSAASPPSPRHLSGEVSSPAGGYSGGSPKEVRGRGRQDHGKSPMHLNDGHPQDDDSEARIGSSEGRGKPSETFGSPGSHQIAASSGSRANTRHSTGKKAQTVSANHLLNFQYDPITFSRPQPRGPPPRRQQKRKPYNKDLFFQANYKFVVLESENYTAESLDPDKMLCWEDIICLKYSTPFPVQCPICLDEPLCPQITSCGHIFCFPCILQYFSMEEDDHKGERWKKCPLCFTMISSKDLYTVHIENVKQYRVGDEIEFVLLTRQKSSFSSSVKNNERINVEELQDSFSKFTLTSDVDLSVREAMSHLDSWIARTDSGLVDDIEKLPYVCAAMEQLERRKKYWNEHRISDGKKAKNPSLRGTSSTANAANSNNGASEFVWGTLSTTIDAPNLFKKSSSDKLIGNGEFCAPQVAELNKSLEGHDGSSSSSFDDNKSLQTICSGIDNKKDGDSYNFYQVVDGQHLILHTLNMKCLLHHYGSYERLPNRITGKILQLETITQSEAMRRRYRFLSHFSLTTTFQLCEIDLRDMLPAESLSPFMDEIKNRHEQRKRLARKELKDKHKAETAVSHFGTAPYHMYDAAPSYSMDDFEALGGPAVASTSPPTIGERQSFSNVARLGFAAGHDSPVSKTDETHPLPKIDLPRDSSGTTGWRNPAAAPSFANITSRAKPEDIPHMPKVTEVGGKKGKKSSRVLLSTAGGRRY